MKTIKSNIENSWIEVKVISVTDEQLNVLRNGTDPEKVEVHNELKSLREVSASEEDATLAQSIYTANKPVVSEGDKYQFISMDLTIDNGSTRGILNYRLNTEHKQIRF